MARARRRKVIKAPAPGSVSPSAPTAPAPHPHPPPPLPQPLHIHILRGGLSPHHVHSHLQKLETDSGALALARPEQSCTSPMGPGHSRSPHGVSCPRTRLSAAEEGGLPNSTCKFLSSLPDPDSGIRNPPPAPPRKPKKKVSPPGAAGEWVSGAAAKAKRREGGQAAPLAAHLCASSPEPRAAPVLTGSSGGRPGPATGARGGDAASGRAAGSRRGRGEPPPLLPGAGAGLGRRSGRRSRGRGSRAAASPPPPPRLGNAPPVATPADRRTRERSRSLSPSGARRASESLARPVRRGAARCLEPAPSAAAAAEADPGAQARCSPASTTVPRGPDRRVSPSPRRGRER